MIGASIVAQISEAAPIEIPAAVAACLFRAES
jgi:hypothetical protein